MNFTSDWVTPHIPNFRLCMDFVGNGRKNFLEIGSFEGRSTCWLLEYGLKDGGDITCIDTFNPPWYTHGNLREKFDANVRNVRTTQHVISVFSMESPTALAQLITTKQSYDFIYIDGDHSPAGALTDATMAWQLLRSGGVMLFDDYEYDQEPTKRGIDGFLMGFDGHFEVVLKNYQLAVRKK